MLLSIKAPGDVFSFVGPREFEKPRSTNPQTPWDICKYSNAKDGYESRSTGIAADVRGKSEIQK
jgi:hypothetical protein